MRMRMQGKNRNKYLEKEFDYGTMLGSIIVHNLCVYIYSFSFTVIVILMYDHDGRKG